MLQLVAYAGCCSFNAPRAVGVANCIGAVNMCYDKAADAPHHWLARRATANFAKAYADVASVFTALASLVQRRPK